MPDVLAVGIFLAIVLTYRVTGAHLGAGVTLMIYFLDCKAEKHVRLLFTYLIGQLFGAYLGMIISYGIIGNENHWRLHPTPGFDTYSIVFFTDLIFSLIFQVTYVHIKLTKIAPINDPGMKCFA